MTNKDLVIQLIQSHSFHPKMDDFYDVLFDTYKKEEKRPLLQLIFKVHKLEINLDNFLQEARALPIRNFAEKLWPQILRYDFLPVADALGVDLNKWVKQLPTELQKSLLGKIITVEKWVNDYALAQTFEISIEGRRRLISLATEYLRGVRNREEIKKELIKSFKDGGVELSAELAERFIASLVARYEETILKDEIFTSQKVEEIIIKQKETIVSPPVIKVEAKLPATTNFIPSSTINFDAQAEEIIKKSNLVVPPDLVQRLKTILVSRLREVRKRGETQERLIAHTLNGGMGLTVEVVEKLMALVEEIKNKGVAEIASEIKKPKEEVILEKPLALPPTASELALPLVEKIESIPPPPTPVAPVIASKIIIPNVVSSNNKIPANSSDIKNSAPVLKITEEKFKPQVREVAMPVASRPPLTMAIPQTPSGRSKMEDVPFKSRLMGPIEELKEMDLVEFRRLSPKPKVAADKIIAKVELLAKEGYDKKVKGIEAWQKSPLINLYKQLLSESLNKAKSVADLIKEKMQIQKDTLSEEEFKVIMELNRVLRF